MKTALATLPASVIAMLLAAGCATAPAPAPPPTALSVSRPPVATTPASYVAPASQAEQARRAEFDAALARWHGAPLSELQAKLGKPDSVTRRNDDRTTYAFTRALASSAGTGRFSCTVRYVVDDRTRLVQSHQIDGC